MEYSWERIKLKACQELSQKCSSWIGGCFAQMLFVEQMITGQKPKGWRENYKWLRAQGWKIIENWDIRLAKQLFDLFPSCIPKKHRGETPTAEYNEGGNWIVFFS